MARTLVGPALLLAVALAGPVQGKPAKASGKKGPDCPAPNQINTADEDQLGCPVRLPRSAAAAFLSITRDDFEKQGGGKKFSEQRPAGKGGLRCVQFFKKRRGRTATLYRLFGGNASEFGGHWTFIEYQPGDPSYRKRFGVCKDQNDLSHAVKCTLGPEVEALIAVGPGQSVGPRREKGKDGKPACANICADPEEKYKASRDLQVLLFGAAKYCNQ